MTNETNYKPCRFKCNGATKDFSFEFQVHKNNELFVNLINTETQEVTLLVEGSDYSAKLEAVGGNITTTTAYADIYEIMISRKTSFFQGKSFATSAGFQASEVENAFDRISCGLQDMDYNIETFKEEYSAETNEKITDFEDEVNSKISQVTEAVNQLHRLDEVLETCERYAVVSEEQSIIAQNQAVLAEEKALEAEQTLAQMQEEHALAVNDLTTTKQNSIAEIQACGIWLEGDRLFYKDEDGVVHEFRNDYGGIAPMPVKHKEVKKVENGNLLTWSDPDDSVYQNNVYCTWGNTLIVRKEGSYPESPFDGAIVVNNTIRNQYAADGYLDEVDTSKDWYYRAFPRSINKVYNLSDRNKFGFWCYSYTEVLTESNPAKRITYSEDNEYFEPCYMDFTNDVFKYMDWENSPFFNWDYIRPCMVYNENAVDEEGNNLSGQVMEWLDPDDHSKTIDGQASHVADSTCNANAMVWKKRIFSKRVTVGNVVTVYFSNVKRDKDYDCPQCKRADGTYTDHYFTPMFHGSLINNILYSLAGGLTAISGKTAQNEIDYARANGTTYAHWDTEVLADVLFEEDVFKLVFKNTDSQSVLGNGVTNSSNGLSGSGKSGVTIAKGENYGKTTSDFPVKFRYRENYYAYQWQRVRGFIIDNGVTKIKLTRSSVDGSTVEDYNIDGTGYITLSDVTATSGTSGGYQSGFVSNKYGTFSTVVSGSSSTFIPDGRWHDDSKLAYPYRGGSSTVGLLCGAFCWSSNSAASLASWYIGASLSCKPL